MFIKSIDRGGFGEVWYGQDVGGRRCAVKILRPDVKQTELDAYRIYHNLTDSKTDGLIQIYTLGHLKDGRTYCSMQLADDLRPTNHEPQLYEPRTLAKEIASRPRPGPVLNPDEALAVTRSILQGLHSLHAKGLVHCDVKPANMLCVQGRWLLGDTGLLRRIEDLPFAGGTARFHPPEGIRDRTADLYALGKSLYQMVTGELDSFPAPLYPKTVNDDSTLKRQYRQINRIVLKACDPDQSKRYQSAAEMLEDVGAEDKRPTPRWLLAPILILSVLAIACGILFVSKFSRTAAPSVPLGIQSLVVEAYSKNGEALGPVGPSVEQLHFGDAVKLSARLSKPAFCYVIAFNPDGRDQLLWPTGPANKEGRDIVPIETDSIDFMQDPNWYFHLTDGVGMQVFVVVASPHALPAYARWKELHSEISWQSMKASGCLEYDDGAFHPLRPVRGPIGPTGEIHPVKQLADSLKSSIPDVRVRAIAFPVLLAPEKD
ncbi:MAG: hypothetical protein B6D36_08375 [Planctomycetes bacterium UTPLA1]|nr:MAG: hypothetical protein B6D36_08375 [Planctomycetes bacterium UTPLA1]